MRFTGRVKPRSVRSRLQTCVRFAEYRASTGISPDAPEIKDRHIVCTTSSCAMSDLQPIDPRRRGAALELPFQINPLSLKARQQDIC
jgi:hypothetical protein